MPNNEKAAKDAILSRVNNIMDATDLKDKANIKARGIAISLIVGSMTIEDASKKLQKIEQTLARNS